MQKIIKYLHNKVALFGKKQALAFFVLVLLAVFLRTYNFDSWLHFELDQARDATLIQEAMDDGIGKLPLLGPRAAGTFLRLGPIFYYIQYFFSVLIGDSVIGSAWAILFFSLLSVPVFYFLFRRYFSKNNTLLLLAVFGVSLYVITYSRFSWNPNMLPFFILAFLLSLLFVVDKEMDEKNRGYWLMAAAFFFGVISQLHFLALIIFSVVAVLFLAYKKARVKFKFWFLAILIFFFLYTPVLINEYKTEGLNSKLFISAITKKSGGEEHNLPEKLIRNFTENADYYWIIITGSQTAQIPKVDIGGDVDVKCDMVCRDSLWEGFLALSFFCVGALLLLYKLFKTKNGTRKDFLVLSAILFGFSFLVFTPLAFDFSARFFLIILLLPFVFLGLLLEVIADIFKVKKLIGALLVFGLIFILVFSNLFFLSRFFGQLDRAKDSFFELPTDKILKQKTRITLEQEVAIVNFIEDFYKKNSYPVIYKGQSEFHRSFAFLFDQRKIPRDGIEMKTICRNANYFLIFRTQSDLDRLTEKYREKFDFVEEKQFGTLTVFHLVPKADYIICEDFNQKKFRNYKDEGGAAAKRYNWEEIFK